MRWPYLRARAGSWSISTTFTAAAAAGLSSSASSASSCSHRLQSGRLRTVHAVTDWVSLLRRRRTGLVGRRGGPVVFPGFVFAGLVLGDAGGDGFERDGRYFAYSRDLVVIQGPRESERRADLGQPLHGLGLRVEGLDEHRHRRE